MIFTEVERTIKIVTGRASLERGVNVLWGKQPHGGGWASKVPDRSASFFRFPPPITRPLTGQSCELQSTPTDQLHFVTKDLIALDRTIPPVMASYGLLDQPEEGPFPSQAA